MRKKKLKTLYLIRLMNPELVNPKMKPNALNSNVKGLNSCPCLLLFLLQNNSRTFQDDPKMTPERPKNDPTISLERPWNDP